MPRLTDQTLIRAILETERPWTAYALADLEPVYSQYASWFGAGKGEPAIALLYQAFDVPVLMTIGKAEHLQSVLGEVDELLEDSPEVYIVARSDVFSLLRELYRLKNERLMLRMLLEQEHYNPVGTEDVKKLGPAHLNLVKCLYAEAEMEGEAPEFFLPSMLETGVYYGVQDKGELIAIAGTHVVAPTVGVGGLGNIYTRRDRRNQGLASRVTRAVINQLLEMDLSTVVLNVRKDNHVAIQVYEQLGFKTYCNFFEALAFR